MAYCLSEFVFEGVVRAELTVVLDGNDPFTDLT